MFFGIEFCKNLHCLFSFNFKAVESLSASSSSEEQEVTTIEKHTKVNYLKEEYTESTVRETHQEIHHHIEASLDDFLVGFLIIFF